jgi:hypothetical protein
MEILELILLEYGRKISPAVCSSKVTNGFMRVQGTLVMATLTPEPSYGRRSIILELKETLCVLSSATFIPDSRPTRRIEDDYYCLMVGASKKPGPDSSTSNEKIAILEYAIALQKSERGEFYERVGLVIINQNVLRFSKAPIKNIEIR